MLRNIWFRQIGIGLQLGLAIYWATLGCAPSLWAQGAKTTPSGNIPEWWKDRDVILPEKDEINQAPAQLGQLKWLAKQAREEVASLLGGIESPSLSGHLSALVDFGVDYTIPAEERTAGNLTVLNLGQLKNVALRFYNLVNEISPTWVKEQLERNGLVEGATYHQTGLEDGFLGYVYGGYYPWNPDTAVEDNKAIANQGQLKLLYSLRFRADGETTPDGLSDLFEHALLAHHPAFQAGGAYEHVTDISQISMQNGELNIYVPDAADPNNQIPANGITAPLPGLASANASVAELLNEHEAVGAVSGNFSVGGDGSALYTMPIDLPKGTAGVAPKLAVAYSSNGGNGTLGLGFDITGLQRITRGGASFKKDGFVDGVDFDANDRFFFDGEALICVKGTHGANASEYRTQNQSFARIILHDEDASIPGPDYWEVHTKSGLKLYLGGTPGGGHLDSCVNAPTRPDGTSPGVLVWGICYVQDTLGNYYEVRYDRETPASGNLAGSIDYRPSEIRYTGHNESPVIAPYNLVKFVYEDRNDTSFGYISGVEGAEAALQNLAKGGKLPDGLTREALETYGKIAQNAIDGGIDKIGTQAARLKAIQEAIKRVE